MDIFQVGMKTSFSLTELKNQRRRIMRRKLLKKDKKTSAGKVVTGMLLGGVVGATVGWLTAPASGQETRRRLRGDLKSAREKIKTSQGNVESQARELVEEVSNPALGL
jgi:YtxH-like protein